MTATQIVMSIIMVCILCNACYGNKFCQENEWSIMSGEWEISEAECVLKSTDITSEISTIWIGIDNVTDDVYDEEKGYGQDANIDFPSDYTIKSKIKITESSINDNNYCGILVRTNTVYNDGYCDSYLVRFVPLTNMIEFVIGENDNEWNMLAQYEYVNGIQTNVEYNVNIEVDHHVYKISINDETEIIRHYDTTYEGGLFGLTTSSNIKCEFNDVRVSEFNYTEHRREYRKRMRFEAMRQSIDPPILPFDYQNATEQMEDTNMAWTLLLKYSVISWDELWDLVADEGTVVTIDDRDISFELIHTLINYMKQYNFIQNLDLQSSLIDFSDFSMTFESAVYVKLDLPVFGSFEGTLASYINLYEYGEESTRCVAVKVKTDHNQDDVLSISQMESLIEYLVGHTDEKNENVEIAKRNYRNKQKPKSTENALKKFNQYKFSGKRNYFGYKILIAIILCVTLFTIFIVYIMNWFIKRLMAKNVKQSQVYDENRVEIGSSSNEMDEQRPFIK